MKDSIFYVGLLASPDMVRIAWRTGEGNERVNRGSWASVEIMTEEQGVDQLRKMLLAHPVGQNFSDWSGQIQDCVSRYTRAFRASANVDYPQWLDSNEGERRVIFWLMASPISNLPTCAKALSLPVDLLKKDTIPGNNTPRNPYGWIEDLLVLRYPVEIRLTSPNSSECGDSSQSVFAILVESDPGGQGTDDDMLNRAFNQQKDALISYLGRCLGREPDVIEQTAWDVDWWRRMRMEERREDLGKHDLVVLRSPTKDQLKTILGCLPIGRNVVLHYCGKTDNEALHLQSGNGRSSILRLHELSSVLISARIDLFFIGACHTTRIDPDTDTIMIQDENTLGYFLEGFVTQISMLRHVASLVSFRWTLQVQVIAEIAERLYYSLQAGSDILDRLPLSQALFTARRMLADRFREDIDNLRHRRSVDYRYAWLAPLIISSFQGEVLPDCPVHPDQLAQEHELRSEKHLLIVTVEGIIDGQISTIKTKLDALGTRGDNPSKHKCDRLTESEIALSRLRQEAQSRINRSTSLQGIQTIRSDITNKLLLIEEKVRQIVID